MTQEQTIPRPQSTPDPDLLTADCQLACHRDELIPFSGVCVLLGGKQIALFYLPGLEPAIYAIDNRDPIGRANVLSRGICGDIEGQPVVASPLYKQHFSLTSGKCLEDDAVSVSTYPVIVSGDLVYLQMQQEEDQARS